MAVARHRRLLAAGAVAAAVASGVQALTPDAPATRPVWVAARDLPAGHRLTDGDLHRRAWPVEAAPGGAAADATALTAGVLAGPVRRGEPITDVRLLGPGLLAGRPPGTVAVTVRVADPASTLALRPGGRVDVLALPTAGAETWQPDDRADLVAAGALVLALPGSAPGDEGPTGSGVEADGPAGLGGGLLDTPAAGGSGAVPSAGVLLLAVDRATATRLAAAQAVRALTVVVG